MAGDKAAVDEETTKSNRDAASAVIAVLTDSDADPQVRLAAGTYRLQVRARMEGSTQLRTGELEATLTRP